MRATLNKTQQMREEFVEQLWEIVNDREGENHTTEERDEAEVILRQLEALNDLGFLKG
jgi:hypothetical protein